MTRPNTVVQAPLQQIQRIEPQQIHQIITTPQTILQQAVPTSVMSGAQKPVILIAKKGVVGDQFFIPLTSNGNVQNVPFSQGLQKIQMQPTQQIIAQQPNQAAATFKKVSQNNMQHNAKQQFTTAQQPIQKTVQQQPVIQKLPLVQKQVQPVQRLSQQTKQVQSKPTKVTIPSPKSHKNPPENQSSKIVFCKF